MSPFLAAYNELKTRGQLTAPRGHRVLEIEDFSIDFHPILDRFSNFDARKMSIDYAKKEMAWYLRGDRYEMTITEEAQMWKQIIDVDGGINSNYGQYIFHDQSQYKWVIAELKRDKDSRRASMMLLNHTHFRPNNPDVVCTYAINFRIRNNRLNMSIHMRSWDAIWGMTNDVFCFSVIYEVVYSLLREHYVDLQVGNYHHTADSFHVYERHFKMLDKLISDGMGGYKPVYCPTISGHEEAKWLIRNKSKQPFPKYRFSEWLFTV